MEFNVQLAERIDKQEKECENNCCFSPDPNPFWMVIQQDTIQTSLPTSLRICSVFKVCSVFTVGRELFQRFFFLKRA